MKLLIACISCILVFISCQKDNKVTQVKEFMVTDSLTIVYGSICGWCSGIDSLTIISNDLSLVSKRPCDSPTKVENKTITNEEKSLLLNSLDFDEFSKIELNTCNVCADGCDTWLSVKKGNYYHSIRYGFEDSVALYPIKSFIDNLNTLRAKFN